MIWSKTMDKNKDSNNSTMHPVIVSTTEQKDDKFLKQIPTKDDEILKKLDEVNKKLESFEISEENEKDDEKDNKKDLRLSIAFVALIVVAAGFFVFKKEVKNSNE